jgi:hypothetical protein
MPIGSGLYQMVDINNFQLSHIVNLLSNNYVFYYVSFFVFLIVMNHFGQEVKIIRTAENPE